MKTIVANFGLANWAWADCLRRGTIAVMDDARVHDFWLAGDKEGYIRAAQKHLHAPGEPPPRRGVASRWFGLNTLFMETDGDLWLHKEGDSLWWTTSTGAEPTHEIVDEPRPRFGGKVRAHLYHKPCTGWSDRDRKGAPLLWSGLHPKAQDFLKTQGTFSTLKPENARYARALVDGGDLSGWYGLPKWTTRQADTRRSGGRTLDPLALTIADIAMTVMSTVAASGSSSISIRKDKQLGFATQAALEAHIAELAEQNEMICALTGLEMQPKGGDDDALRMSLDRIDSDGHYARGNLQLVCKFVNFWKRDQPDEEFKRLMKMVQAAANPAEGADAD